MTTPSDRLRALHRHCSCWGESCKKQGLDLNSHCYKCLVDWPCDTIKALDAADALADAAEACGPPAALTPADNWECAYCQCMAKGFPELQHAGDCEWVILVAAGRAYRGTQ
jgi:hypothetical protein